MDNVDGFIFKLDQMGNILWSKRYFSQEVFDLASVGTNLFSISRDTQSSKSLWLIKLDSVGSAIWSEPTFVRYEHYSKGLLNSVPQILNIGDSLLAISGSGVEIKDTSGAGDTFLAGLVYEYLASSDIGKAIEFANKCATQVVQKKGTAKINKLEL